MIRSRSVSSLSQNQSETLLAIGPLNVASQGSAWSRAVREQLNVNAFSTAFDGPLATRLKRQTLDDRSERPLPHYRLSPMRWRRIRTSRILRDCTHILNEGNMPLVGRPGETLFTDEFSGYVTSRPFHAGVVFHGSDARDPKLSMELNPHSFFFDVEPDWSSELGSVAARNRTGALHSGLPIFVTTPDMLQQIKGAIFLPLTVEPSEWQLDLPAFSRRRPRVLHRPGSSNPHVKGTSHIMPVLERFEAEGRIEIVRAGVIPHREMPSLYREADIVVDQLRIGAYGVTAVEAMAAARLVVAHVSSEARRELGDNVPVVEATPDTFADVMHEILCDLDRAANTAAAGPAHIAEWHNGDKAASVLKDFLSPTVFDIETQV